MGRLPRPSGPGTFDLFLDHGRDVKRSPARRGELSFLLRSPRPLTLSHLTCDGEALVASRFSSYPSSVVLRRPGSPTTTECPAAYTYTTRSMPYLTAVAVPTSVEFFFIRAVATFQSKAIHALFCFGFWAPFSLRTGATFVFSFFFLLINFTAVLWREKPRS